MKKWMLALILLVVIIAIPLLCIVLDAVENPSYGKGSIIFLEHKSSVRGRLINGTYPAQELAGEGYQFDPYEKALTGYSLTINDSLQAILGVSKNLMEDAGNGVASEAHGIYALPSSVDGIKLEKIFPDGTVDLIYNGTRIVLAPGERWETVFTDTVDQPDYSIHLIKSDSIKNDGALPKASL